MKIQISLDAKPFSINKAYYLKSFNNAAATKVRTKECREWGDAILSQLQLRSTEIHHFSSLFDETQHALSISICFYQPKSKFYTKQNTISIASSDLTNVEKLLVDLLFDSRFNDRYNDVGQTTNFNINDKYIVDLSSKKRPSNMYKILVDVEIIKKPEVEDV